MSSPPPGAESAHAAEASRLCCACGLCCQGLLHSCAKVHAGEAGVVERLGLPVFTRPDGHEVFALPCPKLEDDRCTVYDERPRACRAFRCALLKRLVRGEIGLDAGLAVVRRAKQLIGALRRHMGSSADAARISDQVRRHETEPPVSYGRTAARDEYLMDLAELAVLCRTQLEGPGARETPL